MTGREERTRGVGQHDDEDNRRRHDDIFRVPSPFSEMALRAGDLHLDDKKDADFLIRMFRHHIKEFRDLEAREARDGVFRSGVITIVFTAVVTAACGFVTVHIGGILRWLIGSVGR